MRLFRLFPMLFFGVLAGFIFLVEDASAIPVPSGRDGGLSLRVDGGGAAVSNGEIVGVTLALANADTDSVHTRLQFSGSSVLTVLGNPSPLVKLGGEGKLFLPIKIQVASDAPAGEHELAIRAFSASGELLATQVVAVDVQPKRAVWLQPLNTQELMRHAGDSVSIRIAVRNTGNTIERVKLLASYPEPAGGRRFASMEFSLAAATDTTIAFRFIVDRYLLSQEHVAVYVTGLYANDDVFGNAAVNIQNAAADRRYASPSMTPLNWDAYQANRVTFMVRNPTTVTQSWQLDGRGAYALGPGELNFNVFAYQWGELNSQPVLQNTWVGYETDRMGITLGNISESLETYVYGRGAKVRFSDTQQGEHIEFGVVERSFDLLGSDYRPDLHNGYTAYFRTRLGEGQPNRKRYTGTAVYERLPRENSESMLYMSSFDLLPQGLADRIQVTADFGPGLTRPLRGDSRDDDYKPSLAAGLQLHARAGGWAISSTNYYSTAYYPGIRRGALQLNQRVSRVLRRANVWAGYSLYEYAPEYFERQPFLQNRFLVSRAELGVSLPVSDFTSFSVTPLHEYESGHYIFGGSAEADPAIAMHAYRLSTGLNWRGRNYKQSGYLTLENGLLQASLLGKPTWQSRLNFSYSYDWLNINANVQRGSFTLMELANNWYFQREAVFRVGMSASARKDFFRNKLRTDAGVSYYRDSFSGENWTGTARVQYAVARQTSVFAYGQMYHYGNAYYRSMFNANIQLGVQQGLPARNVLAAPKKGNIELLVYHDHNRNGQYDEGDTPASNAMVMIGSTLFIADASGEVRYRHVPYGPQRISVPVQQGWYAQGTELNVDRKRVQISVPLQQAGTVEGRIRFEFDQGLSYEANTALGGYVVTAKSTAGFTARTITDGEGRYTLFLPAGDYEISLLESKMPQHVYPESPVQLLTVLPHEQNAGPAFVLTIAERQVEIKRFTSP